MKNTFTLSTDPSLEHVQFKLITGFLITLVLGVQLGVALVNYDNEQWRPLRPARTTRIIKASKRREVAR